jgi:hypothetical protein
MQPQIPLMGLEALLVLVLSALPFYYCWQLGRSLVTGVLIRRLPETREIDLAKYPIPARIMPLAEQLVALDMELIGVTKSRFWLMGEAYTWYFLHPNRQIYAELIELMDGGLAFDTWYANDAFLHTAFPFGNSLQRPNLHARFAARSAEAAFDYHVQQMQRWEAERGHPVEFSSMSDILRYEKVYYEQHRQQMNARIMRHTLALFVICLVLALNMVIVALIIARVIEHYATLFDMLFQAGIWVVGVGLIWFIQRQQKSTAGAIEAIEIR